MAATPNFNIPAVLTMQLPQKMLDDIGTYAMDHDISRSEAIRLAIANVLGDDYLEAYINAVHKTPEQRKAEIKKYNTNYKRAWRARNSNKAG